MDTYFSSLFFSFITLFVYVASQTCEKSHSERCLKQLLTFTDRGDLQFASTVEELEQECVQAQAALQCLTRYNKKCLPQDDRSKFNDDISGPERITIGLCKQEEFKLNFINSLPCLKNISDGLQYCKEKYDRNQKDIILVEYEDKSQLQCCSFDGYRRCLRMVLDTQNGCREDTAEFLEELVDRMGGALTQGMCSEQFERCTGHSAGTRVQYSIFLISIAFFTMIVFKSSSILTKFMV